MTVTNDRPIAILGAGLAGLTAAGHLKRHNIPFLLFESSRSIAGLLHSDRDEDGFTFDCGVHFLTNRLAAAIGLAKECRPMVRYGETVYLRGKTYSYPWGLMKSPRYVLSAFAGKARGVFSSPAGTAREHYIFQYGGRLAEEIAVPLTEAWSGETADNVAASVGQKFATGLARMMMLRLAARITKRVIGIGYASTIVESTNSWHVYPKDGIASICHRQAAEVADRVRLNSRVDEIRVRDNCVSSVVCNGEEVPVSGAISTAPVNILAKLVQGTSALQGLEQFEYRAMVFVNLKLDGPSGLTDVVTWVPEREFPFFRVSDIGMGLPWLVPASKAQVTCDIGCRVGDSVWCMHDSELTQICVDGLDRMIPGSAKRLLGSRVVRVPQAYPIFKLKYESQRKAMERSLGVKGLLSVGRNGEFAHILMEDVYWRTRWKVTEFLQSLT